MTTFRCATVTTVTRVPPFSGSNVVVVSSAMPMPRCSTTSRRGRSATRTTTHRFAFGP